MKRILVLLAVFVCLTSLTACNGAAKEEMRECRNCGGSISTDVSFCGYCGEAVPDREPQPTAPVKGEDQQTDPQESEHTHSHARSVVAATCTRDGYDIYTCTCGDSYVTNRVQAKGHSYVKNITPATCTQQGYTTYTCTCGDAYRADFVQPAHRYVNYTCTVCGVIEPNYSGFQAEYTQITAQYDADMADLRSKIAECQSNISNYEWENERARLELRSPLPACPRWFLQQYIDNYALFGDTSSASQAALIAWEQQCNAERAELEMTIYDNQSKIRTEQAKISTYNTMITSCTDQYNGNVEMLERKYGLS